MWKVLSKIESKLDWLQGIGFGGSSIKQELNSFKKYIHDGKIFVDAGANKGKYTQGLLDMYDPSEIHVFEPAATNIKVLKASFENNKKVFINDCGLSNVNSVSTLYSDESGSGLGSLAKRKLDHFGIDFSVEEKVKLIRFDEYWEKNIKSDVIDLFKMDVEGHELKVLEGLSDRIKDIKVIQFEFGGCNIDTRSYFQDFWYLFAKHNFEIYRITPIGNYQIKKYKESDERFIATNYFAVNRNLVKG
jgi:FkbM family methyltransferase